MARNLQIAEGNLRNHGRFKALAGQSSGARGQSSSSGSVLTASLAVSGNLETVGDELSTVIEAIKNKTFENNKINQDIATLRSIQLESFSEKNGLPVVHEDLLNDLGNLAPKPPEKSTSGSKS